MKLSRLLTYSFEPNVGSLDRVFRIVSGALLAIAPWTTIVTLPSLVSVIICAVGVAWLITGLVSRCGMYYTTTRAMIRGSLFSLTVALAYPQITAAHSPVPEDNQAYGLAIASDFAFEKKSIDVMGSHMTYVDEGSGPIVLFLHGNPTSSYLWRNIIPYVTDGYRAIAPDLIGMGDSGKPDISYSFDDHAAYLDGFIDALALQDITLVIHDWGSALGMRYARMNPDNVQAMAFMEAIVPPAMPVASYEAMGEAGELFKALRTSGQGEQMVLEGNFFVEEVLPSFGVVRALTEQEMSAYRKPYPSPGSRLPTLVWPRELPIGGKPENTTATVNANGDWLYSSDIPKLLFHAIPGALTPEPVVEHMVQNIPNLETRFLGRGLHFLQEDHPDQIGAGIRDWLRRIATEKVENSN